MTQLESPQSNPSNDPAESIVQLERDAVARLMKLNIERAEAESKIMRESQSDRAIADRQFQEKMAEIEQTNSDAKHEEERTHRDTRSDMKSQLDTKYAETEKKYHGEQMRLNERADHDEVATKKAWEEATWTAETVYDAKSPQPAADFKTIEQMLKGRLASLNGLEKSAIEYLERFWIRRMPALSKSFNTTVCIEGATSATDQGMQLDDMMREATARSTALTRTLCARLMEGLKPFFFFLLPLVGATAIFGAITDWQFNDSSLMAWFGAGGAVIGALLVGGMLLLARKQLRKRFVPLIETIEAARKIRERYLVLAAEKRAREEVELKRVRDTEISNANDRYHPQLSKIQAIRGTLIQELDDNYSGQLRAIKQDRDQQLRKFDTAYGARMAEIEQTFDEDLTRLQEAFNTQTNTINAHHEQAWSELESQWNAGMAAVYESISVVTQLEKERFPNWGDDIWHIWKPPTDFAPAVRFGGFDINLEQIPGGLPNDPRLVDVGPFHFTLPAMLDFPRQTSLLIETGERGRDRAVATLQNVMLRLLTSFPPGKVRFTIVDPVGLGQNFAAFMHLADYEEAFISDRIWTETRHIEQRLLDLTEHMENVIQKYLRNDFATITEYNKHAGEIAEPFRFLVIANFPVNFSDAAARRLVSIVESGARCGVYTLVSMDTRHQMPQGFQPDDLRAGCTHLLLDDKANAGSDTPSVVWQDEVFGALPLELDDPPSDDFLTQTLHLVGESAKDSTRVEVPFEHVAPTDDELWTFSATRELSVPLGRAGATKLQMLSLGRGMAQHVLIAGKTGSGKSTLLHVLVTNLALRFRPDEVEFYLVDFKKGVEFKTYATHNLPHARAVAIESDREFGLSVLQRVDNELRRRGEIFRRLGVQDLTAYRETDEPERIPRTLLMIDEFQEFFVEDDKLSQDSALLLDRLVRQGRAFGIHVLLGSQTLGGAYSLARATIGQMAVRIALQCSENDAMLIMGDDNTAPRLLSRPGEAIYNDHGGLVEGNNPFQIVWLPDQVRDTALQKISKLVEAEGYQPPEPQIVFEGNVPAEIERNILLRRALRDRSDTPKTPRVWLGDAIAIKDPTAAVFRRQSGSHLLIVGQRDEAALAMEAIALVSIAALTPVDTARIFVLDGTPEDDLHAHYLEHLGEHLPHNIHAVRWHEVEQAMSEMGEELERRQSNNITDSPPFFVLIHGLQKFRMLRTTEEFGFGMSEDNPATPDKHLGALLRDGPPFGMHAIIWCDTVNNLSRTLDRNALREFNQRVLFQMSGTDSSTLVDTPIASVLGQNRALFFSEDHGVLEKFRPYALPEPKWLAAVERMLH